MNNTDARKRMAEALKLLDLESTSFEKLEAVANLLKGFNPKLDSSIETCIGAFSKIKHLQKGELIELTAESLPEETEEEKKRKKAILAFIRSWDQLKEEVTRVQAELDDLKNTRSTSKQTQSAARIITFAKGPLGLITIAAVLAVGTLALFSTRFSTEKQTSSESLPANKESPQASLDQNSTKTKTKVIIYNNKKIPLTELTIGQGPECAGPHYHTLDHALARSLDGSTVQDPGNCGFGIVENVAIIEAD